MRPIRTIAFVAAGLLLASACGGPRGSAAAPPAQTSPPHRTATATSPAASTSSGAARPTSPSVTKLLVFVVENHSLDEMRAQMPYTYGLGRRYGYASDFTAITHPSLPNYLAMTGGSTFDVTDDGPPAAHVVHGPSVFGQALAHGKRARLYAEGMPADCALEPGGDRYAVKHNPWAYFVDERTSCDTDDVSLSSFGGDVRAGRLPNAGMVVPNTCDDAHDPGCDLDGADRWLHTYVGQALGGPDFRSGRLTIVITADEDDKTQGNRILTCVIGPRQHARVVRTHLTDYSIARLYEQVLGVPFLRNARTAPDMAAAFNLPVPRR